MSDPILRARVQALEEQLTLVERSPEWLRTVWESTDDDMQRGLDDGLGLEARNRKRELDEIRATLDEAGQRAGDEQLALNRAAWNRYFEVQLECEAIFGECLRFLGGLAIRNKVFDGLLDSQIWEVADELVRSCARESTGRPWTSLTVPAPREAVARTLARMIRLRFPAWNIWTIPLAAREYGHVAAEETRDLPTFVETEVETLVRPQLGQIVEHVLETIPGKRGKAQLRRDLATTASNALQGHAAAIPDGPHGLVHERVGATLERERTCVRVLTADAFATYTLGVAYASAALLLRFEPTRGPREDLVSDAERGEVVLAMLERMDEKTATAAYTSAIARLRTGWTLVLQHTTKTGPDQAHATRARDFVDRIWGEFDSNLLSGYRLDGWLSAKKTKKDWDDRGAATTGDFHTEGTGLGRLPDALNSAWFWRLEHPDADDKTVTALEKATLAICRGIIDASRPTVTEGRRGSVQLPTPVSAPAHEEPKTT